MSAETVALISQVETSYEHDALESEIILQAIVRSPDQTPTSAQRAWLMSHMGWDKVKINDEIRRVAQALAQRAIAGSPDEREAALQEAETSAEVFEREAPKLQAKIQEMQQKLDGLERDKRLSAKRVEQQREAVKKLRELAPEFVQHSVNGKLQIVSTQGIGRELREAKTRLDQLSCILNLGNRYENERLHIEYGLRQLCREAVRENVEGHVLTYGYSEKWPALRAEAQQEFNELTEQLSELQAEHDQSLQAAESALDWYSNPTPID